MPGFAAVSAFGVDFPAADGGRALFGNMVLSRYPVLRVLRHQLPWPPDTAVVSMPRVLLEVTMSTQLGAMRVMTTHLEYYSAMQRAAQVEAVRSIHAEACARARHARIQAEVGSPYEVLDEPIGAILTGDFNFRQDDPLHARLQHAIDADTPRLVDTWSHLYPNKAHRHNVGVYDREQWPEPFTCDFIFASEDLLARVCEVRVHGTTQTSISRNCSSLNERLAFFSGVGFSPTLGNQALRRHATTDECLRTPNKTF
jgi:endonuclease/exonuclease/phosphatase family metal-dependent hydrolase